MNWYAHIDIIGNDQYCVRVTELIEEDGRLINGKELLRFNHRSENHGSRLRAEVENIARQRVQQ